MTIDDLLKTAADRKLTMQHLQQYNYRSGSVSKNDHWECSFATERGEIQFGSGRSAGEAIQKAVYPPITLTAEQQQLSLDDLC